VTFDYSNNQVLSQRVTEHGILPKQNLVVMERELWTKKIKREHCYETNGNKSIEMKREREGIEFKFKSFFKNREII